MIGTNTRSSAPCIRWRGHNPTDLADNLRGLDLQVRSANGVPNPAIGENLLSADSVSCVVEAGVYVASVSLHDLGRPNSEQQYTPGATTTKTRRMVTFRPQARAR